MRQIFHIEFIADKRMQVSLDLLLEVMDCYVLPLVSHSMWIGEPKGLHDLVIVGLIFICSHHWHIRIFILLFLILIFLNYA